MYSSVVTPEYRLSRNIRENFAMDVHEALQAFRTFKNQIDCLKNCFIHLTRILYFLQFSRWRVYFSSIAILFNKS